MLPNFSKKNSLIGEQNAGTASTKINKLSLHLKCTRPGGKTTAVLALKLCNMQISFPDGFLFEGMPLNFFKKTALYCSVY